MHLIRLYILVLAIVILVASCNSRDAAISHALDLAGDNRAELEHVLAACEDDTLRLAAARFLVAGLPHCVSASSTSYIPDITTIKAGYLTDNISLAADVWRSRPWSRCYSTHDFCEYILPHRIADEPLEDWRRVYHDRYAPVLDSLYSGDDPVEAARAIMDYLKAEQPFRYIKDSGSPHKGALYLLRNRVGECREACDLATYVLRALGIPVANDCYITSPCYNSRHQWTAVIDTNGMSVPFVYTDRPISRIRHHDERPQGKVYRSTYSSRSPVADFSGVPAESVPQALRSRYRADVTATYGNAAPLEVTLFDGCDAPVVYLGVFNSREYIPVAAANARNGHAVFPDVERDLVYFPVAWNTNAAAYTPCAWPLSHTRVFAPDTSHTVPAALTRKYSIGNTKYFIMALNGSSIELSASPDFARLHEVARFDSTDRANHYEYDIAAPAPARYARFTCLDEIKAAIGEIHFYSRGREVRPSRVYSTYPLSESEIDRIPNINDSVWDSYLLLSQPGQPVIMDLGRMERIDRVEFVPRNDDNFVRRGDIYELMYFAGPDGWHSLGRQAATGDTLRYPDVPARAMLWLRNHTRGKEEWPFYLDSRGRQVFN